MNIKDLEYFKMVFIEKSFSQAALQMHVSQPTITQAIKRLEEEFESELFIRNHSHQELQPTRAGRQLQVHVEQVLLELKLAKKELQQLELGKVRVGLPPIIGNYYLPQIFPALFRSELINKFETTEAGSADLRKQLIHGDLDIALLGSLSPVSDQVLKVDLFAQSRFKIIVSEKSPLAQQDTIKFADLQNENFIVLDKGFVHQKALKQISQQVHMRPNIIYSTSDMHILKALVAEDLGIGFLTESAIATTDRIHSLSLEDEEQPIFYMSTAYRQSKLLSADEQNILELLQKEL